MYMGNMTMKNFESERFSFYKTALGPEKRLNKSPPCQSDKFGLEKLTIRIRKVNGILHATYQFLLELMLRSRKSF